MAIPTSTWLPAATGLGGVLIGGLITLIADWRRWRREFRARFDAPRQEAYTNLLAVTWRSYNYFAGLRNPWELLRWWNLNKVRALSDEAAAAVSAVRILASPTVESAAVYLGDSLIEAVEFATTVLAKEAEASIPLIRLFKPRAPMPVQRAAGLSEVVRKIGDAANAFIAAAQREIRIPGR